MLDSKGMAHSATKLHRPLQLSTMERSPRTTPQSPLLGAVKHLWDLQSYAGFSHIQGDTTQQHKPTR